MSVNRYKPHILILPEDDANRQLANGFVLDLDTGQVQILQEAGGWLHVCNDFVSQHVHGMRRYDQRLMVLLIDFDDDPKRLQCVLDRVPADLADRVFVLGAKTEPEALKQALLASYEVIGQRMAADCRTGTQTIWAHQMLKHNTSQLGRLCQAASHILF